MKTKDYPFRLMSYAEARQLGVPKKRRCPRCGCKTFTLYVDRDGRIIDPSAGRCERQFSCQYHQKPHRPMTETHQEGPPPLPRLYIPARIYERAQQHDPAPTPFAQALVKWAADIASDAGKAFALQSLKDYLCSASPKHESSVIFWFVDAKGNVTDGQIKAFDGLKTDKSQPVRWVHHSLRQAGQLPQDSQRYRAIFGEHLLKHIKGLSVHVYEAPKTAIMMHCMCKMLGYDGQLHVAAGALSWLNYMTRSSEQISRYRNLFAGCKRVVLWPDLSSNGRAAELWQEEAVRIQRYLNVASECYASWADGLASDDDRIDGLDVADWLAYRQDRIGFRIDEGILRVHPLSPRSVDYETRNLPPDPIMMPKMPQNRFPQPPKQAEIDWIETPF